MVQVCCINQKVYRSTDGASEHCLQRNPEITRDITCLGPLSGLTNVLDLGEIQGHRPSIVQTKPYMNIDGVMMELSQAHEKKPSQGALRTPLKWSKELINDVNETKV